MIMKREFKVEWFDDKSETCYTSKVFKYLLEAIAAGYNQLYWSSQRSQDLVKFKVYPVDTYEDLNEELEGKVKSLYTGYTSSCNNAGCSYDNCQNIISMVDKCHIYVMETIREIKSVRREDGVPKEHIAVLRNTLVVASHSSAEAMQMNPFSRDCVKISIYDSGKITDGAGVIEMPDDEFDLTDAIKH